MLLGRLEHALNTAEKVLAATKRFEADLPSLLERGLGGRWVVFTDTGLKGDYASEESAYADAVSRFGREGGFAVLLVAPREPTPISAVYLFA